MNAKMFLAATGLTIALAGCTATENFDRCPQGEDTDRFLGDTAGGLDCLDNPELIEIAIVPVPGFPSPFGTIWASLISGGNSQFNAIARALITFEGPFETSVRRLRVLVAAYGAPCIFTATNDLGEELTFDSAPAGTQTIEILVTDIGAGGGSFLRSVAIDGFECEIDDLAVSTF